MFLFYLFFPQLVLKHMQKISREMVLEIVAVTLKGEARCGVVMI